MFQEELDNLIYDVLISRTSIKRSISTLIDSETIKDLITDVKRIFDSEPMMLRLDFPITIIGDIHGNVDDLIRLFERCGYPPQTKYLFLGDYVDRGTASIEVMVLLLALKYKYPDHINMLRGNHETTSISKSYGFFRECEKKYSSKLFSHFCSLFNSLPISAVLGDLVFCVHGGISKDLKSLKIFEAKQKPAEIYKKGIFTDLLWSDPKYDMPNSENFIPNTRGCGSYFSKEGLKNFLDMNNLQFIIRSHEECYYGFDWTFDEKVCLTIFSNSDYCGHGNMGLAVGITSDLQMTKEIIQPISNEEKEKRRIILPEFLLYKLDKIQSPPDTPSSQPEGQDYDDYDDVSLIVM